MSRYFCKAHGECDVEYDRFEGVKILCAGCGGECHYPVFIISGIKDVRKEREAEIMRTFRSA